MYFIIFLVGLRDKDSRIPGKLKNKNVHHHNNPLKLMRHRVDQEFRVAFILQTSAESPRPKRAACINYKKHRGLKKAPSTALLSTSSLINFLLNQRSSAKKIPQNIKYSPKIGSTLMKCQCCGNLYVYW